MLAYTLGSKQGGELDLLPCLPECILFAGNGLRLPTLADFAPPDLRPILPRCPLAPIGARPIPRAPPRLAPRLACQFWRGARGQVMRVVPSLPVGPDFLKRLTARARV